MTMLSIIIPVYNERDILPVLYERVSMCFSQQTDAYEVVLIDDGSTDDSYAIMQHFCVRDQRWKALRFSRNFGHQSAVTAGLSLASGDMIAVMDADLQDPPEFIPALLRKVEDGYDVVYAVRRKRKESMLKRLSYYVYYRLLALLADVKIPHDSGDFCVMTRKVVDVLNSLPERERFIRGLRSWVGFRQIGVEYERDRRYAGTPKYTFGKLVALAFDGIFNFSHKPLRLVLLAGIILSLWSLFMIFCVITQRALNLRIFGMLPQDVPGWTSLFLILMFLSGLQFIGLGIIAEYIGRLFREIKGRPNFIIADKIGFGSDEPR